MSQAQYIETVQAMEAASALRTGGESLDGTRSLRFAPDAPEPGRPRAETFRARSGTLSASTERRQRGLSRIDVAATYARDPARARSLTLARGGSTAAAAASGAAAASLIWYQCVHKLHWVALVFAVVAFVFGMVSFTTDYWYVTRLLTTNNNNGLFYECVNGQCVTTDWRAIQWSSSCVISDSALRWSYYVNRGFIFASLVSEVVAAVVILFSFRFYSDSMRGHSIAVLVWSAIPVLSWIVAISRFAAWQNTELYCGDTYCGLKRKVLSVTDCDEAFGYSFTLGIISLLCHVFELGFAIARHVFGEWLLEDATGEELTRTIRTDTIRRRQNTIVAAGASDAPPCQAPPLASLETGGAAVPRAGPENPRSDAAAAGADWAMDPASGLEWSQSLFLYRDPATGHMYDPQTELWCDPATGAWYQGVQA